MKSMSSTEMILFMLTYHLNKARRALHISVMYVENIIAYIHPTDQSVYWAIQSIDWQSSYLMNAFCFDNLPIDL